MSGPKTVAVVVVAAVAANYAVSRFVAGTVPTRGQLFAVGLQSAIVAGVTLAVRK